MTQEDIPTQKLDLDSLPDPHIAVRRIDGWIALALFLLSILHFSLTANFWSFLGQPSTQASIWLGIIPASLPNQSLPTFFCRTLVAIAGPHFSIQALNCLILLCASAATGISYLFALTIYRIMLPNETLERFFDHAEAKTWRILRLAAASAAVAQAFSLPIWFSSATLNEDMLFLPGLLLCGFGLMWTLIEDRRRFAFVAAGLFGFLSAQSGNCLAFFPFFLALLLSINIRSRHSWIYTILIPLLVFAAVFSLGAVLSVSLFENSDSYELRKFVSKNLVFKYYFSGLLSNALAPIVNRGWLILFGVIVLPFCAVLITGRHALTSIENRTGILYACIAVASAIALLYSQISPWSILGSSSNLLLTYPLAAITFGFLVIALRQYIFFRYPQSKRIILVPWYIGAAFLLGEYTLSKPQADLRIVREVRAYSDVVLDSLENRDLLIADEIFGPMIRLRAFEREMPATIVTPMESVSPIGRYMMRDILSKKPALDVALDTDFFFFLRTFVRETEAPDRHLALTLYPDIWNLNPFAPLTHDFIFVGSSGEKGTTAQTDLLASAERFHILLDEFDTRLNDNRNVSNEFSIQIRNRLRTQISFVGNNLAYNLEMKNCEEPAFRLLRKLHEFDPENVSVLLNLHILLGNRKDEAGLEQTKKELDEIVKNPARAMSIWDLTRSQGYILSPEAFMLLGWTWTLSGQVPIAIQTLDSALRAHEERDQTDTPQYSSMLISLANIHDRTGNKDEAARYFEQALAVNTNSLHATLGLYHTKIAQHKPKEAAPLLARLKELDLPEPEYLREEANLMLSKGNIEQACKLLYESMRVDPNETPETLFTLFSARLAGLRKTSDPKLVKDAKQEMARLAARLQKNPVARTYHAPIAFGILNILEQRYLEARDNFRFAQRSTPDSPSLLERILLLDYGLVDTMSANETAHSLLRLNPDHPFANYVLGSLAAQEERWIAAREYLQKACKFWEAAQPYGNLAFVELQLNDLKNAEFLIRKAINLNRTLFELHDTLGLILTKKKDYTQAVDAFQRALRLRQEDPVVSLHLALLYLEMDADRYKENILALLPVIDAGAASFSGTDLSAYRNLSKSLRK